MHDLISRKWLMECIDEGWIKFETEKDTNLYIHLVRDIAPSAQPYTDEEIQKMQDIEQTQLDKAYEMGKADALRWIPCADVLQWISCSDGPAHNVRCSQSYGAGCYNGFCNWGEKK